MSNIVQARVLIRGVRLLIWHHFGIHALPLTKKEGVAGNNPTEWRDTVLFDKKTRQLYLLDTYVFGCLREGAKFTKRGKGTLMKDLASTLMVGEQKLFVNRYLPEDPQMDAEEEVYIHVCGVRNPSTKARNIRYRIATQPGWEIEFTLIWDKTIISRNEMQAICIDAGRLVGLGDGRSIGNGRFEIASFEVLNEQKAA